MAAQDNNIKQGAQNLLVQLLSGLPYPINNKWYNNQKLNVDGYTFVGCRFDNCELIVKKGTFVIDHCFFSNCRFVFLNEAGKIVKFYNIIATEAVKYWPSLAPTKHEDGTVSIK